MAAFEARTGDVSSVGGSTEVPGEFKDELADFVQITRRVGEMELAPVPASVRSAIMNAAVAQAELNANPANPFANLLAFLMRPGPVLMAGTALALLVAVGIRPENEPAAAGESGMVAMNNPAKKTEDEASAAPAADEPAGKPAAEAPAADKPAGEKRVAAAAEAKPAVAQPAAGAQGKGRVPRRTFAATPASLGPADKGAQNRRDQAAGELDDLQPKPKVKARKRRASRKVVPPRPRPKPARKNVATALDLDDGNIDNALDYKQADSAGYAKPPPPRPTAKKKRAQQVWNSSKSGYASGAKALQQKRPAEQKEKEEARREAVQAALGKSRSQPKQDSYARRAKSAPSAPRPAASPRASSSPRFQPQPNKIPKPLKESAKSAGDDESVAEKDARQKLQKDIAGEVAKLKKKAAATKTEEGLVAVLRQILNLARKSGDVKTERWASGEIKRVRKVQLARAKKAAAKRAASAKKAKSKAPPAGAASKAKARQRYDVESTSF